MKRGGYIDPCGIWWALPNAKSSSVTFIQRSRKKLAYKQHILQTHSLSNISIKEVVAGKISIGSKIIEEHGNEKLIAPIHQVEKSLKSDERFKKYFKMLTVGLSKEAVQHRMQRDGIDPKILDMDPDKPYSDGSNNNNSNNNSNDNNVNIGNVTLGMPSKLSSAKLKKKKHTKKKSDGLIRKKLHWKKINGKRMVGTIWEKLMEGYKYISGEKNAKVEEVDQKKLAKESKDNVLKPFLLDNREQKEMKALFCISVEKNKKKNNAGKKANKKLTSSSKKKQLVQLLEMTRANNISIVLARFDSASFDSILQSMSSFDPKNISAENYRSLLSLAPTAAELETLKAYEGPTDAKTLGKAERFCLAIGSIPRYTSRIRCFLYSLKFEEAIQDIELDLDLLCETSLRVTNASSLHNALNVILALGNFLNKGGSNGDADGVSIDSLNKLKNVKSYGTKTTALHYFAIVAQSRAPDILKMSEQCGDCRGASSVVLSQLITDLKLLQRGFDMLLKECEKVKVDVEEADVNGKNFKKEIHALNVIFLKSSKEICQRFKARLDEITTKMNDTQLAYANMLKFYGEFETKKTSDFFSGVADFIVEFENARKDNEESRQRAKKRAAAKQRVENMREKTKARARRRSRDISAEQKSRRDKRTPSPVVAVTKSEEGKLVLPSNAPPPIVLSNKKTTNSNISSDDNTDDGEDSSASPFTL